ncbi:hypothetical protein Hanom_Chr03g00263711 [Helianthus anomalus]
MSVHQFRRKHNKYEKNSPCENRTQELLVPKSYPNPKVPLGYKAMGKMSPFHD